LAFPFWGFFSTWFPPLRQTHPWFDDLPTHCVTTGDLLLKIGIHAGPCLAVMLNDRLDYFGQTVNIAARIQGLAVSHAIFASKPVVDYPQSLVLLQNAGIAPRSQSAALKGVAGEVPVYEIP
jgi:class 3 adenylate cyclase